MEYTENYFEKYLIELFAQNGFEFIPSNECNSKRNNDLNKYIFTKELFISIEKINNTSLNEEIKKKIYNQLIDLIKISNFFERNKKAFNYLKQGISIEKSKNEYVSYKLVDFENISNNIFQITNQFHMININSELRIPDVVVYINGIPIIVWELKSPKNDWQILNDNNNLLVKAHNQIENYKNEIPELFIFNFFNVISNLHIIKYGSTFSTFDRFFCWKTNTFSLGKIEEFIKNLFDKSVLLDLLKNFTIFLREKEQKIIATYYQYYAVKTAINQIKIAIKEKKYKGGLIFHATGTGKSNTMIFLSKNFNNFYPKSTILVISDRNDLDEQIHNNFLLASDFLVQEPKQIKSINYLVETLKNHKQNGIFFSTIQKFQEAYMDLLSSRENILIIVDEAHRSHNNLDSGPARTLRNAFPNATFIGFTGTPREDNDVSTIDIFGDIVSTYAMSEAEADGFIVPLKYERRHKKLKITKESAKIFQENYDKWIEELDEEKYNKDLVSKEMSKEIKKLINIYSNPERLKEIAKDFIKIYKEKKDQVKGKAMFLCYNRVTGFNFYQTLINLNPDFKKITKLIATPNSSDAPEMTKLIGSKKDRENWAREFKDENSNFKIAIVIDMWLTGFDNPCLDMLFIDKPIKKHNLIQAISRVNRVYVEKNKSTKHEKKKEAGIIIDYFGITDNFLDALKQYYYEFDSTYKKEIIKNDHFILDLDELKISLFNEFNTIISQYLNNLKINYFAEDILVINQMLDAIFLIDNKKQEIEFLNKIINLEKVFKSTIHLLNNIEKRKISLLIQATKNFKNIKLYEFKEDNMIEIENLKNTLINSLLKYNGMQKINKFQNDKEIKLKDLLLLALKNNQIKNNAITSANIYCSILKLECENFYKMNSLKADEIIKKINEKLDVYNKSFIAFEILINELIVLNDSIENENNKIKKLNLNDSENKIFQILYENLNINDDQFFVNEIIESSKEIYKKITELKEKNSILWIESETTHTEINFIIKEELQYKRKINEKNVIQVANAILNWLINEHKN